MPATVGRTAGEALVISRLRKVRRLVAETILAALKELERAGAVVRLMLLDDGRSGGVRLHWRHDEPGVLRGTIKGFEVEGVPLRFFVENDFDGIQSQHRKGYLHEAEQLKLIGRHYRGGTFVDVGGNVGNHAIYAAKLLNAPRVVVFEPEPLAAQICDVNISLNDCREQVRLCRAGLSDQAAHAKAIAWKAEPGESWLNLWRDNLGGTRLSLGEDGPLRVVRGDDLLADEAVGFLKIDTEGHELRVLAGLEAVIRRCQPPLFVEVENENVPAFETFCETHGYTATESVRLDESCINFLAVYAAARP